MRVVFEAVGFREADDIQPVLRPTLAVVGATQEPLDQSGISIPRFVSDELRDLGWRWRKSRQIEVDPSDERVAIGCRRGSQAFLVEPVEYESVDRRPHPSAIGGAGKFRNRGLRSLHEGPVMTLHGRVGSQWGNRFGSYEDGNGQRA